MKNRPKFATKLFAAIDVFASLKSGDEQESLRIVQKTHELMRPLVKQFNGEWIHDKDSDVIASFAVIVYCCLGKYDEAMIQFNKAIEIDPHFIIIYFGIGLLYAQQNKYKEAIQAYKKAIELKGGFYWVEGSLGYAYGMLYEKIKGEEILHRMMALSREKYISSASIALIYMGLGKTDETFAWLEKAYDERDPLIIFLNVFSRVGPSSVRSSLRSAIKENGITRRLGN